MKFGGDGQRWTLRDLDGPDYIYAERLLETDFTPRAEAAQLLAQDGIGIDLRPSVEAYTQQRGAYLDSDRWARLQLDLFRATDPAQWIAQFSKQFAFSAYRLGTREAFMQRTLLLTLIDDVIGGADPKTVAVGSARRSSLLLRGNIEINPALLVGTPLMARFQPFAAVFTTANGAQVVFVPQKGSFERTDLWSGWPAGVPHTGLAGPPSGAYSLGFSAIPEGVGEPLLLAAVDGANRFLNYMTNPDNWSDESGVYDATSRSIAWTSLLLGFDAARSLAHEWPEDLWTAFRCLDMLAGYWEGGRSRVRYFADLVTPSKIREYAVSSSAGEFHSQWMNGIASTLEGELERAFPHTLEKDRPKRLVEIRNLLHGVAPPEFRSPTHRYEVLRALDSDDGPRWHAIRDVAGMWWSSLLLQTPSWDYLTPSRAPWEAR